MIFQHHRFQIWNSQQHPYKHKLSEMPYSNDALPPGTVFNAQQAMDWVYAVLYPNTQPAVATPAALPLVGNTINDYRVVLDDGDGKAASYRWEQREGEVAASWHKVYDMDWGEQSILSNFLTKTQDVYVFRYGHDDVDPDGNPPPADDAGQHIYGGASANTHLHLHANAGDGAGPQTGYITVYDNIKPYTGYTALDLGEATDRFQNIYLNTAAYISTMTLSEGSITDTTGFLDFDDEHLSTTGTYTAGTLVLGSASITDTSGAISFGDENLTTTGWLAADYVTATGAASAFADDTTFTTLVLAGGSITDTTGDISFDNVNLTTAGFVSADILKATTEINLGGNLLRVFDDTFGNILVTTFGKNLKLQSSTNVVELGSKGYFSNGFDCYAPALFTDNVTVANNKAFTMFDGSNYLQFQNGLIRSFGQDLTIYPQGSDLILQTNTLPFDEGYSLGEAGRRWDSLYLLTGISDGTTSISQPTLQALRNTLGTITGQTLFWNNATSLWEASLPDTEIDHGGISGLSDDDHAGYLWMAGRAGSQLVYGGTAVSENLILISNGNDPATGALITGSHFRPLTDAARDIGGSSLRFKDLYTSGQGIGFRVQNFATFGAFDAASGTNIGRLAYDVTEKDLYFDIGGAWKRASVDSFYFEDTTGWTGAVATITYDVSADCTNARKMVWSFKDVAGDYEQMVGASITFPTATDVKITFDTPIPVGTYALVGVGL